MRKDFNFSFPIDIYKDKEENWRIKGLASTEDRDLQGEIVKQDGLDLSFLKSGKGYINWEHKSDPTHWVGLIDKAAVGEQGLEIEGQLFKNHDQAKAIHQILDSLDDKRKHRIQMSIEGNVIEKSDNQKIINQAKITGVALTMKPVNEKTYAELVKSLASNEVVDSSVKVGEITSSFSPASETSSDKVEIVELVKEEVKKAEEKKEEEVEVKVEEKKTGIIDEVKKGLEDKVKSKNVEKIIDYIFEKSENTGLEPEVILGKVADKINEDAEGEKRFNEFMKSLEGNPFAADIIKAVGHKYIKRTGGPGNYRYWYKDEKTGKITEGKEPESEKKETGSDGGDGGGNDDSKLSKEHFDKEYKNLKDNDIGIISAVNSYRHSEKTTDGIEKIVGLMNNRIKGIGKELKEFESLDFNKETEDQYNKRRNLEKEESNLKQMKSMYETAKFLSKEIQAGSYSKTENRKPFSLFRTIINEADIKE